MRWTPHVIRRVTLQADGEVVWFWRSDAGVKFAGLSESDDRRWQPSMVTGKSTKETVKTIAQGMPADAVYPWLLTRVLFAAHAASGATRIRHSLRPLHLRGCLSFTTRTFRAARMCAYVSLRCRAPLQAAHPVRRGLSAQAQAPLEYWIARSRLRRGFDEAANPRRAGALAKAASRATTTESGCRDEPCHQGGGAMGP
jgi:hypothetical protein